MYFFDSDLMGFVFSVCMFFGKIPSGLNTFLLIHHTLNVDTRFIIIIIIVIVTMNQYRNQSESIVQK